MTCAKAHVRAEIITPDGQWASGTNACRNPQDTCPRQGDAYRRNDYTLCQSVCDQPAHAEIAALTALTAAGHSPQGATAYVYHHRVCPACQEALSRAGVAKIVCMPDG